MTLAGGLTVDDIIDLLTLLLSSPVVTTGTRAPSVSGTLERSIRTVSCIAADVCFLASIRISSISASLGPM